MHRFLRFVRARLPKILREPFCSFSRRLFVDIEVARERDELSVAGDLHSFCRGYPGLNHPRNCCMPAIMKTKELNPCFVQS